MAIRFMFSVFLVSLLVGCGQSTVDKVNDAIRGGDSSNGNDFGRLELSGGDTTSFLGDRFSPRALGVASRSSETLTVTWTEYSLSSLIGGVVWIFVDANTGQVHAAFLGKSRRAVNGGDENMTYMLGCISLPSCTDGLLASLASIRVDKVKKEVVFDRVTLQPTGDDLSVNPVMLSGTLKYTES